MIDKLTSAARAEELRRAFDRSFAEPLPSGSEEVEALLALRVGGDAYAAKLADITGLVADRRIVPLPSASPGFLGIAGLRGETVPVWSLAALLGYGAATAAPRWLILVAVGGRRQALGLAFEQFDGHLNVPRAALSASLSAAQGGATRSAPASAARSHLGHSVRIADAPRAVLDIASIVDDVRQRTGLENHQSETKDSH